MIKEFDDQLESLGSFNPSSSIKFQTKGDQSLEEGQW